MYELIPGSTRLVRNPKNGKVYLYILEDVSFDEDGDEDGLCETIICIDDYDLE